MKLSQICLSCVAKISPVFIRLKKNNELQITIIFNKKLATSTIFRDAMYQNIFRIELKVRIPLNSLVNSSDFDQR